MNPCSSARTEPVELVEPKVGRNGTHGTTGVGCETKQDSDDDRLTSATDVPAPYTTEVAALLEAQGLACEMLSTCAADEERLHVMRALKPK